MELCIKFDAKNRQQYQKWWFALSEILSTILEIGFISNFLLKARVLYLTILKQPLKVETDLFVICLVLPECLSDKICCFSSSDREVNRDGSDAESPLFFSFSASFKNSSEREKVENCLRFVTGGRNLCFYPVFFSTLTMAARAKQKNSGKVICSRNQRALSRFLARVRILNLITRLC